MSDLKNKLKFVEQTSKQNFFIPEDEAKSEDEKPNHTEREINAKKQKRARIYKAFLTMFLISITLIGFGLLWQWDLSLMAIGDAIWLAFAIELMFGWMLFVYNHNILSPFIHGVKSFSLMIIGKKPKLDYYTYMKKIQDDPIPSFYYITVLISAGILLIPALITLFILT